MPLKPSRNHTVHRGFTIVELAVVIIIIGILATVVTLSYTNARTRAKDTERESDILTVKQVLEKWAEENGAYPNQGPLTNGMDTDFPVTKMGVPRGALINPDAPAGTTNSFNEDAYGSALTYEQYGYRAFHESNGAACWESTATCEGYQMMYKKRATGETVIVAGGICTTEIEGECNSSY